jgi:putative transposase
MLRVDATKGLTTAPSSGCARGPWRTPERVKIATLHYIAWFNHGRLFEACGDIPPAELEAARYRQNAALAEAG